MGYCGVLQLCNLLSSRVYPIAIHSKAIQQVAECTSVLSKHNSNRIQPYVLAIQAIQRMPWIGVLAVSKAFFDLPIVSMSCRVCPTSMAWARCTAISKVAMCSCLRPER